MMSVFVDRKQRKERGYSVKDAIESVKARIEETEDIVIMTVDKNKAVDIDYSSSDVSKLIGYLEITKQSIIENL
jgi:hypothetical protein